MWPHVKGGLLLYGGYRSGLRSVLITPVRGGIAIRVGKVQVCKMWVEVRDGAVRATGLIIGIVTQVGVAPGGG